MFICCMHVYHTSVDNLHSYIFRIYVIKQSISESLCALSCLFLKIFVEGRYVQNIMILLLKENAQPFQ